MSNIFSCFQLFILCYVLGSIIKTKGHNARERVTEGFNASSAEEYDLNTKSGGEQHERTLRNEDFDAELLNTEIDVNESNIYELDVNQKREIPHGDLLNYSKLVLETAKRSDVSAQKMKFVFEEKDREHGFKVTTPKDSPYAVLVVSRTADTRGSQCSGTLIAPSWVITTANCFRKEWIHVIIYAGGNSYEELANKTAGSQLQVTESVYVHPEYDLKKPYQYDIALVKLNVDFNLTDTVNTIELSLSPWAFQNYEECEVTAFGNVWSKSEHKYDDLRKAHTLEMTNVCKCLQKGDNSVDWSKLALCSKPEEDRGICAGDRGGGLICDGKLVALAVSIISYKDLDACTVEKERVEICGLKNTISVFLQICPYLEWISSHIASINSTSVNLACYKAKPSNFDTTIQTSSILIITCFLVPQFIVVVDSL